MSKEALLAKEEAHWSAFRSAIVGLQGTLVTTSSVPTEVRVGSSKANNQSEEIGALKHSDNNSTSASCQDYLETKPQSAVESAFEDHTKKDKRKETNAKGGKERPKSAGPRLARETRLFKSASGRKIVRKVRWKISSPL